MATYAEILLLLLEDLERCERHVAGLLKSNRAQIKRSEELLLDSRAWLTGHLSQRHNRTFLR